MKLMQMAAELNRRCAPPEYVGRPGAPSWECVSDNDGAYPIGCGQTDPETGEVYICRLCEEWILVSWREGEWI